MSERSRPGGRRVVVPEVLVGHAAVVGLAPIATSDGVISFRRVRF